MVGVVPGWEKNSFSSESPLISVSEFDSRGV